LENRIKNIINILNDRKAEQVDSIDLVGKQYMVDIVIIATSLNNKHNDSLVTYLKENLKCLDEEFLRVENSENWTIIDLGDILIHLMSHDYREKYKIEEFLNEIKKNTIQ